MYDTPKYLLAGCPTLVIGKAHHRRSTARTALNFIIFTIRLLSAPAALLAKSNIGNPCHADIDRQHGAPLDVELFRDQKAVLILCYAVFPYHVDRLCGG
ncbi:hypothetical protein [Methylobacterium indicum]|uniref:hypothetical protein n=1 Tax=Methylobacterium indicum TaxID=1775910 RepID=UPI000F765EF9|nr:hypothetical protein [Methylobacterium indicum]